jgi:hypothetical protein
MESLICCNFQLQTMEDTSNAKSLFARNYEKGNTILNTILTRFRYKRYRKAGKANPAELHQNDHVLKPGDWVEVRPMEEISMSLDWKGKHKGLYFMPEMEQFCGKKFKVFKRVETIKLESNGEIRTIKRPTFFLEGVFCDGSCNGGCDRSCFHFWRDIWLKKLAE